MGERYAVIGGEGFVGQAIVKELLSSRSNSTTNSLSLTQRSFHPTPYAFIRTDITSIDSLTAAFEQCKPTVVFHTASPHPGSTLQICEKVNVEGTRMIIEACKRAGVQRLVFTSSATVLYEGRDLISVDERMPTTDDGSDYYVATKVKAEKLVLEANDPAGLLTCSLRLAGVFGPGDRQVLPGLMKVLQDHQTMFQIGNNSSLFDFVYIDNVVHAHLLAADRLGSLPVASDAYSTRLSNVTSTIPRRQLPTSAQAVVAQSFVSDPPLPAARSKFDQFSTPTLDDFSLAGKAIIITNGEPVPFWSFCRAVWFAYNGHIPPFTISLQKSLALGLASAAENFAKISGGKAAITSVNVRYVTNHLYFNIERARRVLGYEPVVSLESGIKLAVEWYKMDETLRANEASSKKDV